MDSTKAGTAPGRGEMLDNFFNSLLHKNPKGGTPVPGRKAEMASSSVGFCGPCSRIDKTSSPTKWCMDCEESLCGDCIVTHTTIKALMSHHVIEIEVASSVALEDLSYSKQCKLHPDFIIDYVCTFHDVVCCCSCIATEHRTCESVIPLEVAARNVKTSTSYRDITDGMNHICSNLQTIADDRDINIQKIQQEGDTALLAISSFKASIVRALDEKEKLLISQLTDVRGTSVTKLESERKEAEVSVSLMKKYLQKIHIMKNNGSSSQAFLLLQEMKTVLMEEDMHLEEFINSIESMNLVYSKEDEVACVKGMGSVEVKSKTSGIQYNPLKYEGAQEITRNKTLIKSFRLEKKIHYKTVKKFRGKQDGVSGVIVTENNQVIVSSPRESVVQMYSSDGKYIKNCQLAYTPWDISYDYQSKRIVAALRDRASIQFIDNFEAKHDEYKVPGSCFGVAWGKDNIFVGGVGELYILDLNGKHLRTVKFGGQNLYYVHYCNKKVYISDYKNVYCIQEDGTQLFTFSSPDLKGTDGIATDKNGYVYVVGRSSNNIHRLSSDGTESEVLLTKTDGINAPIALCFNADYSKMFNSNDNGKHILVFSCEY